GFHGSGRNFERIWKNSFATRHDNPRGNSVKIGIPKEIKAQENRVSMIPGTVAELVKRGHEVIVQRGAGEGASYHDAQYEAVGARLVDGARAVFDTAELIVKVKEPQPSEVAMLRPDHILFTYLH